MMFIVTEIILFENLQIMKNLLQLQICTLAESSIQGPILPKRLLW